MNTWIAQFASSTAPRPDLITSTAPLTPEGAAEQLAGDDPPGVSDVRTPHVRGQKAIQGNIHGPLSQRSGRWRRLARRRESFALVLGVTRNRRNRMAGTATAASGPLAIGADAPDFEATTTQGPLRFHEWLGNSWGVLFSHPKDFTPVCTTELGYMARVKPEFDRRRVKVIGLSVDPLDSHTRWSKDIEETQGHAPNYPMIADADLKISKLYGMLPASAGDTSEGRTAVDNQTVRNVYVIGPDKKIKLVISYPMSTGRNFDEVLRIIDSLQLTAKHKVATPANWKPGEDVIIAGSVSDEDAKKTYPQGWQAPKPYIRIVPQPQG